MRAFVLRCEHNDYLTETVVQIANAPDAPWPGLDEATHELAAHVLGAHGDPDHLTFTTVEAEVRNGWWKLGDDDRTIKREREPIDDDERRSGSE